MVFQKPVLWLKLELSEHQGQVLAGLEALIAQGLLSHAEVRALAAECLSSEYSADQLAARQQRLVPLPPTPELPLPAVLPEPRQPTPALNIAWLLGLGVALVVLSSAVLAIAIWPLVPLAVQYLIFVAYTAGFGLTARWTAKQPNLHLTAQALQYLSLSLLPLHTWVIQAWLWQSGDLGAQVTGGVVIAVGLLWLWRQVGQLDVLLTLTPLLGAVGGLVAATGLATGLATGQIVLKRSDRAAQWLPYSPTLYSLIALGLVILRGTVAGAWEAVAWGLAAWGGLAAVLFGLMLGALPLLLGLGLALLHSPLSAWGITLAYGVGLVDEARRTWRRRDVLLLAGLALLLTLLTWQAFPLPVVPLAVQGYPYTLLLAAGAVLCWRAQKPQLAITLGRVATGWAVLMLLLAWDLLLVRLGILSLSTLLALAVATRTALPLRPVAVAGWLSLNAGLLLVSFSRLEWLLLLSAQAVALWALYGRTRWRRPSWLVGWCAAGMAYALAWGQAVTPGLWDLIALWTGREPIAIAIAPESWVLLLLPLGLAGISIWRPAEQRAMFNWWSVVSLVALLPLSLGDPLGRVIVLLAGTALLIWQTLRTPQVTLALLSWGFGLGSVVAIAYGWSETIAIEALPQFSIFELVVLVFAIAPWGCGLVAQQQWSSPGQRAFAIAAGYWQKIAALVALVLLSGYGVGLIWFAPSLVLVITCILTTAIFARLSWQNPIWGWPWAVAGIIMGVYIDRYWPDLLPSFGVYLLTLAFVIQLAGDLRRQATLPWVWQIVPLVYASLGWLSSLDLPQLSGITIATAWPWLAVGRRRLPWAGSTGLVLITLACVFSLRDFTSLSDHWVAPLLALIALLYYLGQPWLVRGLNLPPIWVERLGWAHWCGASVATLVVGYEFQSLNPLWLAAALLAGRALLSRRVGWVDAGLFWAVAAVFWLLSAVAWQDEPLALLRRVELLQGVVLMAALAGVYLEQLQPRGSWQRFAGIYPLLLGLVVSPYVQLLTAAYYTLLGVRQSRWFYAALGLANLAVLEWVFSRSIWFGLLALGVTLLAVASIEPAVNQSRERLHSARLAALSLSSAAIWLEWGVWPLGGLSLALIAWGLWQQTRAFAIVGTCGFAIAIYSQGQVWLGSNPLLLWAAGIGLGIALIAVAAQFESHREQWQNQWQDWQAQWHSWR